MLVGNERSSIWTTHPAWESFQARHEVPRSKPFEHSRPILPAFINDILYIKGLFFFFVQDMTTFKLDTNQTTYDAEDFKFKLEDKPKVTNFTETPLGQFISEMILTVSSSPSYGILTIQVRSSSLDCSFKPFD